MLAQVDLTEADDALISLALVDLGRQYPGPNLVSFIFTIFGHRNPAIKQTDVASLNEIRDLSVPLLRATATALAEALNSEHRNILASFGTSRPQWIEWQPWVRDAARALFLMLRYSDPRFTLRFRETLFKCL